MKPFNEGDSFEEYAEHSLTHDDETTCPRCGSATKGYMRGPCAMWGEWDSWHDEPH